MFSAGRKAVIMEKDIKDAFQHVMAIIMKLEEKGIYYRLGKFVPVFQQ